MRYGAGYVFRIFREAHRLAVAEAAQRVGISAGHLSRIERGERRPSGRIEDALCAFYGTLSA